MPVYATPRRYAQPPGGTRSPPAFAPPPRSRRPALPSRAPSRACAVSASLSPPRRGGRRARRGTPAPPGGSAPPAPPRPRRPARQHQRRRRQTDARRRPRPTTARSCRRRAAHYSSGCPWSYSQAAPRWAAALRARRRLRLCAAPCEGRGTAPPPPPQAPPPPAAQAPPHGQRPLRPTCAGPNDYWRWRGRRRRRQRRRPVAGRWLLRHTRRSGRTAQPQTNKHHSRGTGLWALPERVLK